MWLWCQTLLARWSPQSFVVNLGWFWLYGLRVVWVSYCLGEGYVKDERWARLRGKDCFKQSGDCGEVTWELKRIYSKINVQCPCVLSFSYGGSARCPLTSGVWPGLWVFRSAREISSLPGMVLIDNSSVNINIQTGTHCNMMQKIIKVILYIPGALNSKPAGKGLPTKRNTT